MRNVSQLRAFAVLLLLFPFAACAGMGGSGMGMHAKFSESETAAIPRCDRQIAQSAEVRTDISGMSTASYMAGPLLRDGLAATGCFGEVRNASLVPSTGGAQFPHGEYSFAVSADMQDGNGSTTLTNAGIGQGSMFGAAAIVMATGGLAMPLLAAVPTKSHQDVTVEVALAGPHGTRIFKAKNPDPDHWSMIGTQMFNAGDKMSWGTRAAVLAALKQIVPAIRGYVQEAAPEHTPKKVRTARTTAPAG